VSQQLSDGPGELPVIDGALLALRGFCPRALNAIGIG
jgi:hypothetical protein